MKLPDPTLIVLEDLSKELTAIARDLLSSGPPDCAAAHKGRAFAHAALIVDYRAAKIRAEDANRDLNNIELAMMTKV